MTIGYMDNRPAITAPRRGQPRPVEYDHMVLRLIAEGNTTRQIAQKCSRTIHGVDAHIRTLMNRYGVHSRAQLAIEAAKVGAIVEEVEHV